MPSTGLYFRQRRPPPPRGEGGVSLAAFSQPQDSKEANQQPFPHGLSSPSASSCSQDSMDRRGCPPAPPPEFPSPLPSLPPVPCTAYQAKVDPGQFSSSRSKSSHQKIQPVKIKKVRQNSAGQNKQRGILFSGFKQAFPPPEGGPNPRLKPPILIPEVS